MRDVSTCSSIPESCYPLGTSPRVTTSGIADAPEYLQAGNPIRVASPAHHPNHFDTLGHLGLIYLALIFIAGAVVSLVGITAQRKRADADG